MDAFYAVPGKLYLVKVSLRAESLTGSFAMCLGFGKSYGLSEHRYKRFLTKVGVVEMFHSQLELVT